MSLVEGSKAPDFTAEADEGKKLSLEDFRGKWVVLYFYPKDNTSGCTREACDFRDNLERLTATGAEVIGVSPDSISSHDKFRTKYNLNFHLVSDTDKTICNAYGVWQEKNMMGRKYMGVVRTTFIINPEGKIARTFPKVKVEGHVQEVLKFLESQEIKS